MCLRYNKVFYRRVGSVSTVAWYFSSTSKRDLAECKTCRTQVSRDGLIIKKKSRWSFVGQPISSNSFRRASRKKVTNFLQDDNNRKRSEIFFRCNVTRLKIIEHSTLGVLVVYRISTRRYSKPREWKQLNLDAPDERKKPPRPVFRTKISRIVLNSATTFLFLFPLVTVRPFSAPYFFIWLVLCYPRVLQVKRFSGLIWIFFFF